VSEIKRNREDTIKMERQRESVRKNLSRKRRQILDSNYKKVIISLHLV
jgi:hypothetical protein